MIRPSARLDDRRYRRSDTPIPLSRRRDAAQHGTRSKYAAGCGCDACREAERLHNLTRNRVR